MKPITSLVESLPVMVSQLIDSSSASWKEDLVREVFIPIDVDAILGIPLCTRRIEDFWAWVKDKRGIYLVRSCYRMLMHTKRTRENYLNNHQGG